eukprot:TRINITY_DN8188_c0_g1_i1.p1 TRINITY_DN8188_c0_g1~~TRINITY_DN8188_c0_g1_i1.p1  ORF type:complete len:951 (+),score=269.56 TRINITY_DN8188_c0_g1_i1:107-2854(+)
MESPLPPPEPPRYPSRTPSPAPSSQPSEELVDVYTRDVAYCLTKMRTSGNGLSEAEASERSAQHGKNEISEEEEESLVLQFLEKFTDPMVVLLLASACISLLMREFEDALSIILAVVIVSTVGFVQEYKSEKAVEALKEFIAHRCVVLRDGNQHDLLATELALGDVVVLGSGCRVPADLRLIEANDLNLNESLITGESHDVEKHTNPIDRETGWILAERKNMVCLGSTVTSGNGRGIVVSIGDNTELGKISKMLAKEEKKTPLQTSMDQFGKQLSVVSLVVIIVISLIGYLQGKPFLQMFNMAVSLVVAAIPEGLPIAVTVTLALGVTRMSTRNAIVRKLPAVEALGATNVICVDKTGTLTQNKMTVTHLYTSRHISVTSALEHSTDGAVTFTPEDGSADVSLAEDPHLRALIEAGVLCNNAQFSAPAGGAKKDLQLVGLPTEGALLSLALKSGVTDLRTISKRLSETPFDSNTKYMSVSCETAAGPVTVMKGAPEIVLDRCTTAFGGAPLNKAEILDVASGLARKALRVLALARGDGTDRTDGLTFIGLAGLIDPPRKGVREAIREARQAHVQVVMITGDGRETALAIAEQLGLPASPEAALSPYEMDQLTPKELQVRAPSVSVFYRMTPGHKLAIVNTFKANGNIVAMTGDGVNDAPALSKSDIGIAMGRGGSDVTKEASEIILVDNNFRTIVAAIEEGKAIFNNIKNFLHFQLTTSIAAMGLVALCSIVDLPLPLNPMQILWINIIMDGPPAQSLTFEARREETVRLPPRNPNASIVDVRTISKIVVSAFMMIVGTLWIFLSAIPEGAELKTMNVAPRLATTLAFTTFVLFQLMNAYNCRSLNVSIFKLGLFSNHYLLLTFAGSLFTQLLVVYVPFLQAIFQTAPLSLMQLLQCLGVSSSVVVVDELWKLLC